MNLYSHKLTIAKKQKLVDITSLIKRDVKASGIKNGIVVVYCPHTTAGITINENADPDVCTDLIYGYEKVFPKEDKSYLHFEGNSHAHMKATAFGSSQVLIIENKEIILGVWQSIYFGEFDGPRTREFYVKIIEG